MSQTFDPEVIKAQIANLAVERDRIDQAIYALETALRNLEGISPRQRDLLEGIGTEGMTLHDAVKQACTALADGITRQRVIATIEREHPFLKPKSSSVAASLINLAKGQNPMLKVAIPGRGRSPAYYSTEEITTHNLSSAEAAELLDPVTTRGTGGWQSLFSSLQKNFNRATGTMKLTAEQRARIFEYYRHGTGGWQDRVKRIFRRELPHLFAP